MPSPPHLLCETRSSTVAMGPDRRTRSGSTSVGQRKRRQQTKWTTGVVFYWINCSTSTISKLLWPAEPGFELIVSAWSRKSFAFKRCQFTEGIGVADPKAGGKLCSLRQIDQQSTLRIRTESPTDKLLKAI